MAKDGGGTRRGRDFDRDQIKLHRYDKLIAKLDSDPDSLSPPTQSTSVQHVSLRPLALPKSDRPEAEIRKQRELIYHIVYSGLSRKAAMQALGLTEADWIALTDIEFGMMLDHQMALRRIEASAKALNKLVELMSTAEETSEQLKAAVEIYRSVSNSHRFENKVINTVQAQTAHANGVVNAQQVEGDIARLKELLSPTSPLTGQDAAAETDDSATETAN